MIVNRSEQRRALLDKFTDPDNPPFPDAVRLCCDDCGALILWVAPPLPADGRTFCDACPS